MPDHINTLIQEICSCNSATLIYMLPSIRCSSRARMFYTWTSPDTRNQTECRLCTARWDRSIRRVITVHGTEPTMACSWQSSTNILPEIKETNLFRSLKNYEKLVIFVTRVVHGIRTSLLWHHNSGGSILRHVFESYILVSAS